MGRNLSTLYISSSFEFLTQLSGSELQTGLGQTITGSLLITASLADTATTASYVLNAVSSSFATSASFATTASFALNVVAQSTSSLLTTASAANNIITFTKGDASTFTVTVATGSVVSTGSLMVTGSATNNVLTFTKGDGSTFALTVATGSAPNTGSLLTTASISNATTTFTKGDATTFSLITNNVVNATSASVAVSASYAVSASQAQNAVSASFAPAGNPFPFTGSAIITGSLIVTGSIEVTKGINSTNATLYNTINSAIIGGFNNTTNNEYSAVAGGYQCTAGYLCFVGGGYNNNAGGGNAGVIVGGESNTISSGTGFIVGGAGHSYVGSGEVGCGMLGGENNTFAAANVRGGAMISGKTNTYRSTGVESRGAIIAGNLNIMDDGAGGSGANMDSVIIGGRNNRIANANQSVAIIASSGSIITNFSQSVIIGGKGITASANNTVYVPNLNVSGSSTFKQSSVFTGSIRGNVTALTISSQTASLDCSLNNFYTLTLVSGSTTFVNPSNILPGQTINVRISQASVASGSISFASSVKQVSGSAYTPTATVNAEDIVTFISYDSTNLYLSNIKNFV